MSDDSARPLGEWLRQRREELGISLEQAQADTRIRVRYLKALEAEEFDALPDPFVGRGFLRNYAVYLRLDPQEAASRFSRKVAPPEPVSLPAEEPNPFAAGSFEPVPLHKVPSRGSHWAGVLAGVAVLVAALSLLAWWGYTSGLYAIPWRTQKSPSTPTTLDASPAPSTVTPLPTRTAAVTLAASAPQATPTPRPTLAPTFTPSPTLTPTPPIYTGIFLELVFTGTSWIRITVDNVRSEQGVLPAGSYRSYYGQQRIEVRIGDAASVIVTVNGQKLGVLGGPGEVVDRIFELAEGQVNQATALPVEGTTTPTAVVTETSTTTPTQPTASPTVSPSPSPTVTGGTAGP